MELSAAAFGFRSNAAVFAHGRGIGQSGGVSSRTAEFVNRGHQPGEPHAIGQPGERRTEILDAIGRGRLTGA